MSVRYYLGIIEFTSGDMLHVHPGPQVQSGHKHKEFSHFDTSISVSLEDFNAFPSFFSTNLSANETAASSRLSFSLTTM